MKAINTYIIEKFQVSAGNIKTITYTYKPKNKDELIKCIEKKIEKEGLGTKDKPLNLNDIDTSEITDMSFLFDILEGSLVMLSQKGYFDISDWDVSNVKYMESMFYLSAFDGDISDWDVSNVENMRGMFYRSQFSGNIDDWDVSNVDDMQFMFADCPLENNPPKWYKTKR